MRLRFRRRFEPVARDPAGTLTGWFVPSTPWLAEATRDYVRVWEVESGRIAGTLLPSKFGLGRPNGGLIPHPSRPEVVTIHERLSPGEEDGLVVWSLPGMRPELRRRGHAGSELGIQPGSEGRGFVTFGEDGLAVWNEGVSEDARWTGPPAGEPLLIESEKCVAIPRCRIGDPGVELRAVADGRLLKVLAEDAPVTHLARLWDETLWLFQEGGRVEGYREGRRAAGASLDHPESLREDFPSGCAVCLDRVDEERVALLTADGVLGFYRIPQWTLLHEKPFEMTPSWIDVQGGRVAVGFFTDAVEIFDLIDG